ncbi:hypothetical protein AAF712_011175 [Marasmius tenuissimus]|uniref:Uncharacterized protein n=1 Tax=Marasmius tenuissimus TaxID=585030 RepID=A0ABR2ZLT7_9AGAR
MFKKQARLVAPKITTPPVIVPLSNHEPMDEAPSSTSIEIIDIDSPFPSPHLHPQPLDHHPTINAPIDVDQIPDQQIQTTVPCKGLRPQLPSGKTPEQIYPFYLHSSGSLPWDYAVRDGTLVLRHKHCEEIVRSTKALDMNKKFIVAIGSGGYERTDRLVAAWMRRKGGIHSLMSMYERASAGLLKVYGYTEKDYLRQILNWRIGGQRLVQIAQRSSELPGLTSVRNHSTLSPLLPSPSFPKESEIQANVISCFEGIIEKMKAAHVQHAVLMFDEICTTKHPRFDPHTNMFLGACREGSSRTNLTFNSAEDLEQFMDDLDAGVFHLASEATVGAVGMLSSDKSLQCARPVLISGDCKHEKADLHAKLIQTTIDGVNKEKSSLSPESNIYHLLSNLALMDLQVGPDDITPDKDHKHVDKGVRNTLLRQSGMCIEGTVVTPDLLKHHLRMEGSSAIHIRSLFNPEDKQDVKLAFDLLKDIWNMASLPELESSRKPYHKQVQEAIRIMGQFFLYLIFPYVCVDLSLAEQLEYLSTAAHLMFALYSHQRAGKCFIPTTLYIDIMLMIRNVYFCVAKSKVDDPDGEFWLVLLGTDRLEIIFGILRTMVGNDANLDVYQAACRLTGTTEVANILATHPEWQRTPRRMKLPSLDRNQNVLSERVDHLNPQSWRGDVHTGIVSLYTCWKRGRRIIEEKYSFAAKILAEAGNDPNITLLAPFGTLLVNATLDPDDVEEDPDDSLERPTILEADNTEGSRMVEDAAAEESAVRSPQVKVAQTIAIGGKDVKKSKALADRWKLGRQVTATSTDRLKRLEDEARYKPMESGVDEVLDVSGVDQLVMLGEPIAILLRCKAQVFLCIALVNGIRVDAKPVEEIPSDMLHK